MRDSEIIKLNLRVKTNSFKSILFKSAFYEKIKQ